MNKLFHCGGAFLEKHREEDFMFDKRSTLFPSKHHSCFLSHCAVSPLYVGAASAAAGFQRSMVKRGVSALADFGDLLPRFRQGFASLMKSSAENISFVHSTAEAMCQIANGYPFEAGDQIISYVHEYPSNHYPWLMQKRRGVELILLPDSQHRDGFDTFGRTGGWSMADLERLCTPRTRIVAISHVQFVSGFGADLAELGDFCRKRDIDLIVDGAQSLGCLPLYPQEYGISAMAASGWKWLLGPKGAAILHTSEQLRRKLTPTMAGPGMMMQTVDYLDHSWAPFSDGRMFEYSTIPWDHVAALAVLIEDVFNRYPIEDIRDEVFRLQDLFLDHLDPDYFKVQRFERKNRSGIIAFLPEHDPGKIANELAEKGVVITERAGCLRLAPHFYLDDEEVVEAAAVCNECCIK
jgi:cysteine desulfurase/selenocysteine lyase